MGWRISGAPARRFPFASAFGCGLIEHE
jgi:hypothetical protein